MYGRGSIGGTISVNSNKPDLDNFGANAEATYGEFNTINSDGMVNYPVIDGKLAIRVAAQFSSHDGTTKNIGTGGDYNSLNDWGGRVSVRWQPTDSTTLDVTASMFNEADSRTRIDNTMCERDPTGVLGCLPNALALQPVNTYSRTDALFDSVQFFNSIGVLAGSGIAAGVYGSGTGAFVAGSLGAAGFLSPANTALALGYNAAPSPANGAAYVKLVSGAYGTLTGLAGITNVLIPNGPQSGFATAAATPQDLLKINSSATPHTRAVGDSVSLHLHQKVSEWLDADVLVGHDEGRESQFGSYTTQPDENVQATLNTATSNLFNVVMPFYFISGARQASLASTFFGHSTITPTGNPPPGPYWNVSNVQIPLSNGIPGGSINEFTGVKNYSSNIQVNDLTQGHSHENSVEFRLSTNLDGPFNVITGLYYWEKGSPTADYHVMFNGGDYGAAVLGQTFGSFIPSAVALQGQDPLYFQQAPTRDHSMAAFTDMSYVAIPDLLTFKAGIRWSQDVHTITDNVASFVALNPGTAGLSCIAGAFCFLPITTDAAGVATTTAGALANYAHSNPKSKDTSLVDFRGVVEYTPKLDFTDQTFIYATISRGSKPGNSNLVPATAPPGAIPAFYQPEELLDYELGVKNTLLDGTLQANFTGWYYDYKNFQYSSVAYSTSYTQNLNAKMWGGEGEFVWQPDEDLAFNLNLTESGSEIGNSYSVDQRNLIYGQTNGTYIKDTVLTTTGDVPGQTCALYSTNPGGGSPADDPAVTAAYGGTNPFIAPPGGSTQLAAAGIAHVNFGVCGSTNAAILNPLGYYYYGTGPQAASQPGSSTSGFARLLKNNPVPNLPNTTISVGAQYTMHFGGYTLVPRLDYYWQGGFNARVFGDPVDQINAWDQLNLQMQLNAPDSQWFARVFATNVMDNRNIQGQGLQSDTSGLATNVFLENPRVIGITVGGKY